jgi:2-polyprenyl-6-methoxyphenol hydroxylase-like FAD-dependent oxidoreductase
VLQSGPVVARPGHPCWKQHGWFRQVPTADFVHHCDAAFENPMIDCDPVSTWRDGPVALLGDAAHAMVPTGSNGAGQAIIDARELGAAMVARCQRGSARSL